MSIDWSQRKKSRKPEIEKPPSTGQLWLRGISEDDEPGRINSTSSLEPASFLWSTNDPEKKQSPVKSPSTVSSGRKDSRSASSTIRTKQRTRFSGSLWDTGSIPKPREPQTWVPKFYMERAVKAGLENPIFAHLLDPGLGKTSIMLATFDVLRSQKIVRKMLVIAPLRVCYDVWPGEVEKWKDFNHLRCTILHGSKKEERLHEDADIYLLNPEGVDWLTQTVKPRGQRQYSTREWDWPEILVFDESTRFKHGETKRFKSIKTVLDKFDRRYILTGTPAPNGYHDLWGQYYLLDFGERLGEYVTHFRRRYFIQGWDGFGWEIRDEKAEEEIEEAVSDITLRLAAEDYLKLPPLITKNIGVELPPEAMRLYGKLKTDLVLRMDAGEVTAANAGVLSSKLRQAANGRVYLDEDDGVDYDAGKDAVHRRGRKIGKIHDAKIKALTDLVEELQGQPLMVAYEFRHDLDALQDAFGDVPVLGAGTTPARGRKITKAWNRGELPLLFAHPQSAGHGLNLQEAGNNICWFSLTWNLEHHEQLIRRQWRLGQKKPVFVFYLLAKGTIDAHVAETIADKDATQQKLLTALKADLNQEIR